MRRDYPGEAITVTFDAEVCTHAANCVRSLAAVFDTTRRPWIDPDGAPVDEVIATVDACPSGALGYRVDRPGA